MVEDDTTTSPPPSPPPPPPPADARMPPRELRRSRTNRVVAGVAAGIGRYFEVDPVIVRIAFMVLALFGGSGVLLYLVAWLVIAKEGDDDSAAARVLRGSEQPRGRGVIAALLVLAAVFVLSGPVVWFGPFGVGDELFFPLLLVAAGVALLLWPDDQGWSVLRPGSGHGAEPAASDTDQAAVTPSTDLVPRSRALAEIDEVDEIELPLAPSGPTIDETVPATPPEPERRTFPVTSLTLAVLLVMAGGAVLLDRLDVMDVRPVGFLATVLVVIGLGLVLAAFVGRARGLIALGLLILPLLWFATVVDIEWWSGVGDERVVVDDPEHLAAAYHHGIGHLVVDLRDLDLAGQTTELAVGLTIGRVEVIVPPDVEVDIDADGRIGQIVVEQPGRDQVDDGMDTSIDTTIPGTNGLLELDLDVGLGEARVEVAA